MDVRYAFAGIAAADYPRLRDWYERFIGRPPDLTPKEGDAAWRLTDSGWIYVVDDPTRAGRGLLTLLVDDLDARVAELNDRGLEAVKVEGALRRAVLEDPEGNRITLAQATS